jgi:hypothetical protein
MEIYADETNERVFVGDGRGPYTVVERDGSTSESFIPRGAAKLVFDTDPDLDAYAQGFDEGYKEGRRVGQAEVAEIAAVVAEANAARRQLTARIGLRYRPLSLKSVRGRP